MDLDNEEVSLFIMRLLFQIDQQENYGILFEQFIDRLPSSNVEKSKTLITENLEELIQLGLIDLQSDNRYYISEKGLNWYHELKYNFFSHNGNSNSGLSLTNCHNITIHNYSADRQFNQGTNSHFPGNSNEFIPHYKKVSQLLSKLEERLSIEQKSDDIQVIIDELKTIIELNSLTLNKKL